MIDLYLINIVIILYMKIQYNHCAYNEKNIL